MTFLSLMMIFNYLKAGADSRCVREGEEIINAQHLILCGQRTSLNSEIHVVSLCLQTSALQTAPHRITGVLDSNVDNVISVKKFECTCKAGLSGCCKHIAATLLYCSRRDLDSLEQLSSTDIECYWTKVKTNIKETYQPIPVCEYDCLQETQNKKRCINQLTEEQILFSRTKILACNQNSHFNIFQQHIKKKKTNNNATLELTPIGKEVIKILQNADKSKFINCISPECESWHSGLDECCTQIILRLKTENRFKAAITLQGSTDWKDFRQLRITGSTGYSIFTHKKENWEKKIRNCFFPKEFSNKYTEYGRRQEPIARELYSTVSGHTVCSDLGFFIPKRLYWLGFSPDGVVFENGQPTKLLEIKCPYKGLEVPAEELLLHCNYLTESSNGEYTMKQNHAHYAQIQLGMALLNVHSCDFIIYSSKSESSLKLEVPFNAKYAKELIITLTAKYMKHMIHSICLK